MTDFLEEKRKEIQARLKELKPIVDEYQMLLAADEALGGLGNGTAAAGRRGAARARSARAVGGATGARRGRPKGSGTRAAQARDSCASGRASRSPSSPRRWDPAELPLSRDAGPRRKGQGDEVRPRLAPTRES